MYTSVTSEPAGTLANGRRQVTDIDVVKIEFAGGGSAAASRRRRLIVMLKPDFFWKLAADSS